MGRPAADEPDVRGGADKAPGGSLLVLGRTVVNQMPTEALLAEINRLATTAHRPSPAGGVQRDREHL